MYPLLYSRTGEIFIFIFDRIRGQRSSRNKSGEFVSEQVDIGTELRLVAGTGSTGARSASDGGAAAGETRRSRRSPGAFIHTGSSVFIRNSRSAML